MGSGGNNKGGAADDLASVVTGLKIATRLRAKAEQASQHVATDMAIRHLKKSLSQRNNDDNQQQQEEDTRALVHQRRSGNARKLREGGEQHHQHNPLQSLWRSVIRKTDEGESLPPQMGGAAPEPGKVRAPRRSVS